MPFSGCDSGEQIESSSAIYCQYSYKHSNYLDKLNHVYNYVYKCPPMRAIRDVCLYSFYGLWIVYYTFVLQSCMLQGDIVDVLLRMILKHEQVT